MGSFFSAWYQACQKSLSYFCLPKSAWKGLFAEWRACLYLLMRGLRLLQWRYRCCGGEIDLIMRHRHVIVFVEVRYRSSLSHGGALLSVNQAKRHVLRRTASAYLQTVDPQRQYDVRFDVIAIDKGHRLQWVKNAFTAQEP